MLHFPAGHKPRLSLPAAGWRQMEQRLPRAGCELQQDTAPSSSPRFGCVEVLLEGGRLHEAPSSPSANSRVWGRNQRKNVAWKPVGGTEGMSRSMTVMVSVKCRQSGLCTMMGHEFLLSTDSKQPLDEILHRLVFHGFLLFYADTFVVCLYKASRKTIWKSPLRFHSGHPHVTADRAAQPRSMGRGCVFVGESAEFGAWGFSLALEQQ